MLAHPRRLSLVLFAALTGAAAGQPPPGGPPGFQPVRVVPPPVRDRLGLTPEQEKQIDALEADVRERLETLLTREQWGALKEFRPRGAEGRPAADPKAAPFADAPPGPTLVLGGPLRAVPDPATKAAFALTGDAFEGVLGDPRTEPAGRGVRLPSGDDQDRDGTRAGTATWAVTGLTPATGRWVRVRVRGLAQDGFRVDADDLYLKVEFLKDGGKNPLDHVAKTLYPQVERYRKDLADPGTNKGLGAAGWQTFTLDVRTPFPEVDTVRATVGYGHGSGPKDRSEFWVAGVEVGPIPDPAGYAPPARPAATEDPPTLASLVKLGGRWYYDPRGGDRTPPARFDHTNADRLLYKTDRLERPFAGNTSAWLRAGYQDRDGNPVGKDRFVPDAVTVTFTDAHLVVRSHNLPNHPTAAFPDRTRFLDGNPNVIRERADVWHVPLDPKPNPHRVAMTADNKRALPMGPIGVAANGVVFFNPFDHIAEADAVWRLDRCCGHPAPTGMYHYHKYPACVNTPWDDDGSGHSPVIGWAFDGYPVYGPYEAKGVLAKDARDNPLDEFNLHADAARGPHYHVTPGKFPHVIGGYWGTPDPRNRPARGGPPR